MLFYHKNPLYKDHGINTVNLHSKGMYQNQMYKKIDMHQNYVITLEFELYEKLR